MHQYHYQVNADLTEIYYKLLPHQYIYYRVRSPQYSPPNHHYYTILNIVSIEW